MRPFLLLSLFLSGLTASGSITLPIEVLGAPGHVESVTLNLPAGASKVTGLKLKIHGLTFENKASVKINNSAWIDLNDQSVQYPPPERAFWGMGGPLSTLRMVVPVPKKTVQDGANSLQFRFNDRDGKSIGYRILALNWVAGTQELIPAAEFVEDDPRAWQPPLDTPEAISEGKTLWYSAPLMESATSMRVNCTDCHAHDGRDLKFFNYSNKSIIERSIFHKLSRQDSEKIASYIRSLEVPYEELGRPWNPPYQPGPGLDAKPVRSWAAGAGLGWVLDNELETLRYIFPGGPKPGSLDFKQTVNAREIPLGIQLPDWNHWLPQIHPKDAYPDIYSHHPFVERYETLRQLLKGKTGVAAGRILDAQKSNWDRDSTDTGLVKPNRKTPEGADYAYRQKGISHWRVIKTWELMTEFQAEDVGHELGGPNVNDRRWFHGEVFRLAPHLLNLPLYDSWYAESMQWYQLQMVLNDGNRRNGSIVPIDWGYLHSLNFSAWNNPAGMPTYGIAILNMVKGGEVGENGLALGRPNAWNPFKENIYWLAPGRHLNHQYEGIDLTLRRQVAEALVTPWLAKAESYSRDEYEAAGLLNDGLKNLIVDTAQNLDGIGVDPALIKRMQTLSAELWPGNQSPALRPEKLRTANNKELKRSTRN